ncbi:permease prefix domain 1-containing protein [Dactylosporangium matsuzakiense]|uniref:Uncharacterized protein n=1 Tax=Dactylosporangium matsuzakiense TaxID=53360 RepID=A0A9W6NMX5_9ACTN|nr:permease prefix domain 1-containing protein [Dactylosporangium matsuzakiense]UWZ43271.1 hypothetical protein Dmats_38220 [Dactylosporangium matsuzakiense]GLL02623.1 hypothetical protein GCM10017581_043650 [Dactylosporangium matsuzakiense]
MSDIERYLDELFDRLAGHGSAGRRMLEEAEQHLRTAAAERVAAGVPVAEAEREAVARFGAAELVAGLVERVGPGARPVNAAATAGLALLMLAGVYLGAALALLQWGSSEAIMRQTAVVGVVLLGAGGAALVAVRARPPYAWLAAAGVALAGVVVLVDVPLAVGLALGEAGLHRQAAGLLTLVAAVNLLVVGVVRGVRRRRRAEAVAVSAAG